MYTDMLCNKMYMICAMWGKNIKLAPSLTVI